MDNETTQAHEQTISAPKKARSYKTKSTTVRFRIEHDVLEKYTATAEELQIRLSEYLRTRINNGHVKVYTIDKTFEKLHYELNKIGVNLNQIAKVLNETREGNNHKITSDIAAINARIIALVDKVESEIDKKNQ